MAREARLDGKGGYLVTLPNGKAIDRRKAMRGAGASYSDVILRLCGGRSPAAGIPSVASLDVLQNRCMSPLLRARDADAGGVASPCSLIAVGGCSASGPEPSFETAYSAVGAQVK
jgi:hypothetical protein